MGGLILVLLDVLPDTLLIWDLRYLYSVFTGMRGPYMVLSIAAYTTLIVFSIWMYVNTIASYSSVGSPPTPQRLPLVTIIVPCYNEELVIERSVKGVTGLDYPPNKSVTGLDYPPNKIEYIYCYDRGEDRTEELLHRLSEEYPIQVLHNESGDHTKAGAINYALQYAEGEVIGFYDADEIPLPENARRAVGWLSKPGVHLVSGRRRIANTRQNLLTRFISLEYHGLYLVEHFGRPQMGGVPLFYGSNGYVTREALKELGGFDSGMLTEDIDFGFRLLEEGFDAHYDPDMVGLDEAPATLGVWWNQRLRWSRGWMQVLLRHFRVIHGRLRGMRLLTARFLLVSTITPLFMLLLWTVIPVHWFLDKKFFAPGTTVFLWLFLMGAPIAYFMSSWIHDARRGDVRLGDLPLFLTFIPILAYFTLTSIVVWNAFFMQILGVEKKWVKTERSGTLSTAHADLNQDDHGE